MVSPIDYTMNVLNPIEGYMQGLKFGEGILGARQGRELAQSQEERAQEAFAMKKEDRARAIQRQQAADAAAAAQRAQAARGQQALLEYLDKQEAGTATGADLRRAIVEFPQVSERFKAVANSFSEERLANEVTFGKQLSFAAGRGRIDAARGLIQERLDAAKGSGDERGAAVYQSQLKMLDADPKSLALEALIPLQEVMSPDEFDKHHDQVFGGGDDFKVKSSELVGNIASIQTMEDGSTRVVDTRTNTVVTGPAATNLLDEAALASDVPLSPLGKLVDDLNSKRITQEEFDLEMASRRAPETTITNVLGNAEGTFAKEFSKKEAARVSSEIELGVKARRNSAQIDDLEKILSEVRTGAGASVKAYLGGFGIETEDLDLIQAAEAAINRLVPEQRAPGSGTMSDADLVLFKKSLPSLINQPGGNQRIINTMRKMNEHDIALGVIASKVADYALTPKEDRAAAEEAGLILSPSAGRNASLELSDPLSEIRSFIGGGDTGGSAKEAFMRDERIKALTPSQQEVAWQVYKENMGITE